MVPLPAILVELGTRLVILVPNLVPKSPCQKAVEPLSKGIGEDEAFGAIESLNGGAMEKVLLLILKFSLGKQSKKLRTSAEYKVKMLLWLLTFVLLLLVE